MDDLKEFKKNNQLKIIIGKKQSGKTTQIKDILKQQKLVIMCEEPNNNELYTKYNIKHISEKINNKNFKLIFG